MNNNRKLRRADAIITVAICFVVCIMLLLGVLFLGSIVSNAKAAKLPKKKQQRLDRAMEVLCDIKTWDKYHVWPSNFAKHCWIESGMWEKPRHGMNGHGEMSSKYYDTVEESVIGFCKVYNNQYFKKCTKGDNVKSANKQFLYVVNKGYCVPKDGYYYKGLRECKKYDWYKYDQKLKKKLKNRKHKQEVEKNRKKPYYLLFDPSLIGSHQIITDSELLPENTIVQMGYTYYEIGKTEKDLGNWIYVGDQYMCMRTLGKAIELENIFLNCKG